MASVHAKSAGSTTFPHAAFHVLNEQHADGAHVNAGLAACALEGIDFDSHQTSYLAQAGLAESFDQPLYFFLQCSFE